MSMLSGHLFLSQCSRRITLAPLGRGAMATMDMAAIDKTVTKKDAGLAELSSKEAEGCQGLVGTLMRDYEVRLPLSVGECTA